jgi:hypothetical protein
MWRVAALVLVLCTGCSSVSTDSILYDSLFGDVSSLFSSGGGSASDPGQKTYMAPARNATSQAPVQNSNSQ